MSNMRQEIYEDEWRRVTAVKALLLVGLSALSAVAGSGETFLCPGDGRLHQLRIYELNPENREHFHRRFQDHALRIMDRHGFEVVDMWESEADSRLQFIYVLAWPDAATLERSWKAFLADPEWIEIKRQSAAAHGELVRSAEGQPLRRVTYSPACKP